MNPATQPFRNFGATRLMVVTPKGITHTRVRELNRYLKPGDLLVINQSATLPASFAARLSRTGEPLEIRLAAFAGVDPQDLRSWQAIAFGEGDWRMDTEARGAPPALRVGDTLKLSPGLIARVTAIDARHTRIFSLTFAARGSLVAGLYRAGRPIQYRHLKVPLEVWDQQTAFADAPISVEPPSAGFAFDWEALLKLRREGVQVAGLLHGAGISSAGGPTLDARLPLEEYYRIPPSTLRAVQTTRERGRRVVAVGTTVARALESAFLRPDAIRPAGRTSLRLGASHSLRVTDALVTGIHEAVSSHASLMRAFCNSACLEQAFAEAAAAKGYRSHEYGDLVLVSGY